MKNVIKMLLVSAVFAVASPVWATPSLAGSATPIEQGNIGLTSPSTPAQIAAALKGQSKYPAKDFSQAEIEEALRSANGWKSNDPIPLNYRFSVPLPVNVPAQKVEPPKTASTEATTPAPAVIPLPAAKAPITPTPELKESQAKLAAALSEKARLEEWSKSLKNRPAKEVLSAEDRQLLNALIVLKRDTIPELSNRVKAIEDRLTVIETNKADISWVGENFATRAWAGLITDRMEKVEDVLNPKSPRYIGKGIATAEKDWLEWSLIFVGIPLSLLIGLLALFPGLRSMIAAFGRGVKEIVSDLRIPDMFRREKVDPNRFLNPADLPQDTPKTAPNSKVTAMPIPERFKVNG